jgi:predicted RNA polymerase sigma factor
MSGLPMLPNPPPTDLLDIALLEILGHGNSYAYSTIATVQRHLNAFHLTHKFHPHEILKEAYLRGKKLQRTGTTIHTPHAWLKITSFNIIREKSRQERAHHVMVFNDHITPSRSLLSDDPLDQIARQDDVDLLYQALKEFEQEDPQTAQLLIWRAIDQLSWEQVSDRLRSLGAEVPQNAALRQRVSRAKKRIRQIMHAHGLSL